jgi:hypothetical protein
MTLASLDASNFYVAAPMPRPAPVIRTVLPSGGAFDSFSVTNLSIVYSPILMSELWINPFVMVRLLKSPSDYAQMALNATSIFFTSIDKL